MSMQDADQMGGETWDDIIEDWMKHKPQTIAVCAGRMIARLGNDPALIRLFLRQMPAIQRGFWVQAVCAVWLGNKEK